MDIEDELELEEFTRDKEKEILNKFKFMFDQNLFVIRNSRISQIKVWLNNFIDTREKVVALFILENIIHRNSEMLEKAITRVLIKEIKNVYEEIYNQSYDVFEWLNIIKNSKNTLNIKFIGVDKGTISQSSAIITRRLSNIVNQSYIAEHEKHCEAALNKNYLIIFIDDFLGSGLQFETFIHQKICTLNSYSNSSSHFIYTPLIAMHKGIQHINQIYQNIEIIPTEIISLDYELFNKDALDSFFNRIQIPSNEMREILINICSRFGINSNSWLGRDDAMLSIIFEWGCPNQTIRLIHHEQNITAIAANNGALAYYPLAPRRA